jgi:hypothetical protein
MKTAAGHRPLGANDEDEMAGWMHCPIAGRR